jgi:integrase
MASNQASRELSTPVRTLSDVLAAVQSADLPPRRREEIVSALRTIGRVFKQSLDDIPAHPSLLGPRLAQAAPIAAGVSRLRWNNVRSLARCGLALVQPMAPGRHLNKLSPDWQQLSDRLTDHGQRVGLSRFMHFCSALGTEPDAVSERTIEAFREHLEQTLKRPEEILSMTAKAWGRAQVSTPDWPNTKFHAPSRQHRWTLPMSALPESFHKDCQVWLDRLAGRDLLDEMAFRPVRPATINLRRQQLRTFASAVILGGQSPDTVTSLRDLVAIDNFKVGLRYLLARANGTPTRTIFHIASALKAAAKHHARVDDAHLKALVAIVNRLNQGQAGLTEKNRARLRPFDDLKCTAALLNLPARLMKLALRTRRVRDGALLAQIATAVELLTFVPIRLHNLVNLDIERNLILSGNGKEMHVVIPEDEVKNRVEIEYPLPAMSVKLIMEYIRNHRPRLTLKGSTALFPGEFGRPKSQQVLRAQISRTIYAYTGLRVNPHLFRHIDAKLYLDRNPGGYEVVRRVLGHRSMNTTVRFYTGTETAAAVRHFDRTILDLRREAASEKVIRPKGTRNR